MNAARTQAAKGWEKAKLADLLTVIRGVTYKKEQSAKEPRKGLIPVLRANNIQNGLVFEDLVYVPEDCVSDAQMLRKGDIVIAASSGSRHIVGKAAQLKTDWRGSFGAFCFGLRPKLGIHTDYLSWFLQTSEYRNQVSELSAGVNINNLRARHIEELQMRVAPLPEQRRIVGEIEKQFSRLEEGVGALKRVQANLKRYRASVLKAACEGKLAPTEAELAQSNRKRYESAIELIARTKTPPRPNRWNSRSKDVIIGHASLAVGNPRTQLPEGWAWTALVEIAKMESGHTPSRIHPEWWDGDVAWIGIVDARENDGRTIHETIQHTNAKGIENSASRLLPAGTVCISRTASVGYVVVMGREMATSQDFVNWVPTTSVMPDWLRIIFSADREALRRFGKGSVHKTIYFPEWLSVHIALPPLAEQKRIVEEVERRLSVVEEMEATVAANLQRATRLRQSILQKAFEGELI